MKTLVLLIVVESSDFFFRNCSFLLAFLFLVDGLIFFFLAISVEGMVFSLVFKEKETEEPIERLKLKALPGRTAGRVDARDG